MSKSAASKTVLTKEEVSSMIDKAIGAPSSVMLQEGIAAFRLNLKAHYTALLYEMRASCEAVDGASYDREHWARIVDSVSAWDEDTLRKQIERLRREHETIDEQWAFASREYARACAGQLRGARPIDGFYADLTRMLYASPEIKSLEFFQWGTEDRERLFVDVFRRALHASLRGAVVGRRPAPAAKPRVQNPPPSPSSVIMPSESASCMMSVNSSLTSVAHDRHDADMLRNLQRPQTEPPADADARSRRSAQQRSRVSRSRTGVSRKEVAENSRVSRKSRAESRAAAESRREENSRAAAESRREAKSRRRGEPARGEEPRGEPSQPRAKRAQRGPRRGRFAGAGRRIVEEPARAHRRRWRFVHLLLPRRRKRAFGSCRMSAAASWFC